MKKLGRPADATPTSFRKTVQRPVIKPEGGPEIRRFLSNPGQTFLSLLVFPVYFSNNFFAKNSILL